MPRPVALPLPATIRAFYGGNSLPARNADQSIYGRDLTEIGTVNTPASPEPPEYDQWLYGGCDPSNLWHAPTTAFPSFPSPGFVGVVAFKMLYHDSFQSQSNIFQIKAGGSYLFRFDTIPNSGGLARFGFSKGSFDQVSLEAAHGMVEGQLYEWRLESRVDGCTLRRDGLAIATSPFQAQMGNVSSFVIGDENFANLSFVDAFMVSDDPDEAFPEPPPIPPAVTGFEVVPT